MQKRALDWSKVRSALGTTLAQPSTIAMLAAPLVGAGVGAVERRVRQNQAATQKATAYREMMGLHPHLKQRDPGEVGRIYNSLYNVSPTMAADPMVAGAWVDNVIESKGVGYNSHQGLLTAVKELSGIERSVADSKQQRAQLPFAQNTTRFVRDFGEVADKGGKKSLKAYAQQVTAAEAARLDTKRKEINDLIDKNHEMIQQYRAERDGTAKTSSSSELDQLFASLGL